MATRNLPQTCSELDTFKHALSPAVDGYCCQLVRFILRYCCYSIARCSAQSPYSGVVLDGRRLSAFTLRCGMATKSTSIRTIIMYGDYYQTSNEKRHMKWEQDITFNQLSKLCCYITFVVLASVEPANCNSEEDGTRRRSAKPRKKRNKREPEIEATNTIRKCKAKGI